MTKLLFIMMAILVLAVGASIRRRFRSDRDQSVTDDIMRQIESVGHVEAEDIEAVNVERVRAKEDEFWAQPWDLPEDDW